MEVWREFVETLMAELMPVAGTRPHPIRDASWWPL
jgi:hypothetical protein